MPYDTGSIASGAYNHLIFLLSHAPINQVYDPIKFIYRGGHGRLSILLSYPLMPYLLNTITPLYIVLFHIYIYIL